jgi:hypothetical protein
MRISACCSFVAQNTFRLIADTGSSNDAILGEDCCGDDADVTFSCSASPTCIDAGDKVSIAFAGANIMYVVPVLVLF